MLLYKPLDLLIGNVGYFALVVDSQQGDVSIVVHCLPFEFLTKSDNYVHKTNRQKYGDILIIRKRILP